MTATAVVLLLDTTTAEVSRSPWWLDSGATGVHRPDGVPRTPTGEGAVLRRQVLGALLRPWSSLLDGPAAVDPPFVQHQNEHAARSVFHAAAEGDHRLPAWLQPPPGSQPARDDAFADAWLPNAAPVGVAPALLVAARGALRQHAADRDTADTAELRRLGGGGGGTAAGALASLPMGSLRSFDVYLDNASRRARLLMAGGAPTPGRAPTLRCFGAGRCIGVAIVEGRRSVSAPAGSARRVVCADADVPPSLSDDPALRRWVRRVMGPLGLYTAVLGAAAPSAPAPSAPAPSAPAAASDPPAASVSAPSAVFDADVCAYAVPFDLPVELLAAGAAAGATAGAVSGRVIVVLTADDFGMVREDAVPRSQLIPVGTRQVAARSGHAPWLRQAGGGLTLTRRLAYRQILDTVFSWNATADGTMATHLTPAWVSRTAASTRRLVRSAAPVEAGRWDRLTAAPPPGQPGPPGLPGPPVAPGPPAAGTLPLLPASCGALLEHKAAAAERSPVVGKALRSWPPASAQDAAVPLWVETVSCFWERQPTAAPAAAAGLCHVALRLTRSNLTYRGTALRRNLGAAVPAQPHGSPGPALTATAPAHQSVAPDPVGLAEVNAHCPVSRQQRAAEGGISYWPWKGWRLGYAPGAGPRRSESAAVAGGGGFLDRSSALFGSVCVPKWLKAAASGDPRRRARWLFIGDSQVRAVYTTILDFIESSAAAGPGFVPGIPSPLPLGDARLLNVTKLKCRLPWHQFGRCRFSLLIAEPSGSAAPTVVRATWDMDFYWDPTLGELSRDSASVLFGGHLEPSAQGYDAVVVGAGTWHGIAPGWTVGRFARRMMRVGRSLLYTHRRVAAGNFGARLLHGRSSPVFPHRLIWIGAPAVPAKARFSRGYTAGRLTDYRVSLQESAAALVWDGLGRALANTTAVDERRSVRVSVVDYLGATLAGESWSTGDGSHYHGGAAAVEAVDALLADLCR